MTLLSVAVAACGFGGGDCGPPVKHTLEAIRASIDQWLHELPALDITYEAYGYAENAAPSGAYVQRQLVLIGSDVVLISTKHATEKIPVNYDLMAKVRVIEPDILLTLYPRQRAYFCSRRDTNSAPPFEAETDLYLTATGLGPDPSPGGSGLGGAATCYLERIATGLRCSVLRPRQEWTSGRLCYVVDDPGVDTMWLDAERGFCMIRRVALSPTTGRTLDVELDEFTEISIGFWLPRRVHAKTIGSNGAVVSDNWGLVTELRQIGEHREAIFESNRRLIPGTFGAEMGHPDGAMQIVPGGEELVDEMARWLQWRWGLTDEYLGSTTAQAVVWAVTAFGMVFFAARRRSGATRLKGEDP